MERARSVNKFNHLFEAYSQPALDVSGKDHREGEGERREGDEIEIDRAEFEPTLNASDGFETPRRVANDAAAPARARR